MLANETELDHKQKSGDNEYRRIKEKLVGKTFTVRYDLDSAVDSFLNQIEAEEIRDVLKSQKLQIEEVFRHAGYNNLRHLHRAFLDFDRMYNSLSASHKHLPGFITDLLPLLLGFSHPAASRGWHPSDFDGFENRMTKTFMSKAGEPTEASSVSTIAQKYGLLDTYNLVLSEQCWRAFFENGYISPDELATSIENSRYAQTQQTPAWLKLWYLWDLDDAEYTELLKTVTIQWESDEFIKPGEILHVAGMLLSLSNVGLRSESLASTLDECQKYVDRIAGNRVWTWDDVKAVLFSKWRRVDGYHNHGFHGIELEEFKVFQKHLESQIRKTELELIPPIANELLQQLAKEPDVFASNVAGESIHEIYHEIPIFEHVSTEEFINALLLTPNKDKRVVGEALRRRYQIASRRLIGERKFLNDLSKRIEEVVNKRKGSMTAYILEIQILSKIKSAIAKLEEMEKAEQPLS